MKYVESLSKQILISNHTDKRANITNTNIHNVRKTSEKHTLTLTLLVGLGTSQMTARRDRPKTNTHKVKYA